MHLAHHSLKKRVNECIAYTFGKNIFNLNEKDFEFLFTIKMSKYEIYFRVDIFLPRFNQLSHCEKKLQLCNWNINVFDNLKGKSVLKTTDVF